MSRPKGKSGSGAFWAVAGAAVVVTGALIAFGVMANSKNAAPQAPAAAVKTDADLKAKGNQMGNVNAKVQIIEWGDYL
ncbi:MAG TPA: hypothetical protein VD969_22980 [Symbiobacteriaceae bacterium]|nr:hypothetical protein [Symbiobacteriaceae bacterium]